MVRRHCNVLDCMVLKKNIHQNLLALRHADQCFPDFVVESTVEYLKCWLSCVKLSWVQVTVKIYPHPSHKL